MKKLMTIAGTALLTACCLASAICPAQAKASLTATSALKSMGVVNTNNMHIVAFSPDNKYLCAHSREPRDRQHADFRNLVYVFEVRSDNSLSKLHTYEVKVPEIEQITFTPDNNSVLVVTLKGTKLIKIDVPSGVQSTIMEHVKGQPGFRIFPNVLTHNGNELLTQGYYYNENDSCGENVIAVVDWHKSGVAAFTQVSEIDKMQRDTRRNYKAFAENYPSKDVGFMGLTNDNKSWVCYSWVNGKGVKSFDKGEKLLGFWGGGERELYSIQRGPDNYDLIVYDAKADKKFVISEGRTTPYMYLFLSTDGKTALFNDADDRTSTTKMYFAREDENWAIKPIADLSKTIRTGTERLSYDGTKVVQNSPQGLRIVDVK